MIRKRMKKALLGLAFALTFAIAAPVIAQADTQAPEITNGFSVEVSEKIMATQKASTSGCDITYDDLVVKNAGSVNFDISGVSYTQGGEYTLVKDQSEELFKAMPAGTKKFSMVMAVDNAAVDLFDGASNIKIPVAPSEQKTFALSGKKSLSVENYNGTLGAIVLTLDVDNATATSILYDANEDFSMTFQAGAFNGQMFYSTDRSSWNEIDKTTEQTISSENGKLYLRGLGNTYTTGGTSKSKVSYTCSDSCKINLSGNIQALLDYEKVDDGKSPTMGEYAYASLFKMAPIVDASKLELPAVRLTQYCYQNMFNGCTSLTTGPELPATFLEAYCYNRMFEGCTSLMEAPELPATTVSLCGYSRMFYGCTSLTTAPKLPATTLDYACYSSMFSHCTSLTTAPELPATTLASGCYSNMFDGCTNLTTAPKLPAATVSDNGYAGMFYGCTSLTTAPELPATTLEKNCYNRMFYGCTNLTTAPELPATTLSTGCYGEMFYGCTSLTTAPELPATTLVTNCYSGMFRICTSLTTAPELPATTLASNCYSQMFGMCRSLTMAPKLPATELADNCYSYMFYGCTSLTTLPELPATTLTKSCYIQMFLGCKEIKLSARKTGDYTIPYRVPKEGTGTSAANALDNMFLNTGGTFTGTPDINTTYYLSSANTLALSGEDTVVINNQPIQDDVQTPDDVTVPEADESKDNISADTNETANDTLDEPKDTLDEPSEESPEENKDVSDESPRDESDPNESGLPDEKQSGSDLILPAKTEETVEPDEAIAA